MEDKYDLGIFIFRKDFRIEDNRGLNKLNEISKEILPIFIFDPKHWCTVVLYRVVVGVVSLYVCSFLPTKTLECWLTSVWRALTE